TCLGKIIGGGFPIGAYGGRRDNMKCLAPLGGVYQAGTFSGNPIVTQAGLATLKNLTPQVYKKLNQQGENFVKAMNAFFEKNNIEAHFSSYKTMISIRFRRETVNNYKDAKDAASDRLYGKLFHHLLFH